MNRNLVYSLAATAVLLAFAAPSHAATIVDTGTPGGNAIGAYALDGNDFYAGEFNLATAAQIESISTHLLGGTAGETFTIALYDNGAAPGPGTQLYSATASVGAEGWNGVSGLAGWSLAAGNYWVGIEVGSGDTLGSQSVTGALLDRGVATPLMQTAFNAGSGYAVTASPLDFGLRVTSVSAVPEPASVLLMLAGAAVIAPIARRRRG